MTQERFAEVLDISVDILSLIERGINAPSFETLEKVGKAGEKVPGTCEKIGFTDFSTTRFQ
jgi:transcriptional regulator with XRE-family HTH domain